MQTKFYRITKDEWEAGSYQTCVKCGARIRNVVEIDGHAHGADCAASTLGWKGTKAQLNKKVDIIVKNLTYAAKVASSTAPTKFSIMNAAQFCEEALRSVDKYNGELYRIRMSDEKFLQAALLELQG